ncbi:hypothetical protein J5N97_023503 [Dioscorea zingiberensis]|uniref:Protein kinase domain-containing protein n=1 Tax=Dioscorea zingiberensis TaxID=325984 RepID=A0A9D5H7W0_9LILI|nr:hypothetical protein J5N97_023503 [Dioscorea zingiberensis]
MASPLSLLLLLLLFFFFFFFSSVSPISSDSSDALLLLSKIKPSLQGPSPEPNLQLSTWNSSTPLCLWRGLSWSFSGDALRCNDSAVSANLSLYRDPSLQLVSIRLPATALSGHVPEELARFSSLRSLLLPSNSLTGSLPLDLFNSPSLSDLDLSSNSINGSLPPSLWNLCDRLVSLRLHHNSISGAVPDPAIPNSPCPLFQALDFGSNNLDGGFPRFLTGFQNLQELNLASNHFSGLIPGELAGMKNLQSLNLSYNNFSGALPEAFKASRFGSEAFIGNSPELCGAPLGQCGSGSGLSSGAIAGIVIGLMAGAVLLASVSIGWVQGRKRRNRGRREEEDMEMEMEMEMDEGENGAEGKLAVFQGGEHLTLEDVLNATGQVMEKTSYGTVYKAKLDGGGAIALRLLREGSCKDPSSCSPVIRQLGRARHENLVPLRAYYQGKRGEKLLIYDYLPNRSLHDLLHESRAGRPLLNWSRRHKIALGIARGLAYLHTGQETPIIHGNVKSKNVLVDEFFVPRLTEFGLDKLMVPAVADEMVSVAKADGYKAPELQKMKKCSPRTDVYAFGILLLEILMGKKPGKDARTGAMVDLPSLVKVAVLEETTMDVFDVEVLKGIRSPTEDGLVQALKLAMGCCAPVASVRPDMHEVVKQLEENRPRNRSALYSPADTRSEIGTPF